MLVNNLRVIMGKKRIDNVVDLMKLTGLSRNALSKLWHDEEMETIKLGTLMRICDALDVKLSDLLEYEPDRQDEGKERTGRAGVTEIMPVLKSKNKKTGKTEIKRTPVLD